MEIVLFVSAHAICPTNTTPNSDGQLQTVQYRLHFIVFRKQHNKINDQIIFIIIPYWLRIIPRWSGQQQLTSPL